MVESYKAGFKENTKYCLQYAMYEIQSSRPLRAVGYRGFVKDWTPYKLTICEGDFAGLVLLNIHCKEVQFKKFCLPVKKQLRSC